MIAYTPYLTHTLGMTADESRVLGEDYLLSEGAAATETPGMGGVMAPVMAPAVAAFGPRSICAPTIKRTNTHVFNYMLAIRM